MRAFMGADSLAMLQEVGLGLVEKGQDVFYLGSVDSTLSRDIPQRSRTWESNQLPALASKFQENPDLSEEINHSLILYTDGQHLDGWLAGLDSSWSVFWWRTDMREDVGILNLDYPSHGLQAGQRFRLGADLVVGPSSAEGYPVELVLHGDRVNQLFVGTGPQEQHRLELDAVMDRPGTLPGELRVSDDFLDYNNLQYFVLPAYARLTVLILQQPGSGNAWDLLQRSSEGIAAPLDLQLIAPGRLDEAVLPQPGTVVVSGKERLADYQLERLEQYIQEGGQVLWFGRLDERLSLLSSRQTAPEPDRNETGFFLSVTTAAREEFGESPLMSDLESGRLMVKMRYPQPIPKGRVWIRFADDLPFMTAVEVGQGRLIHVATDLDLQSSNLAVRAFFPLLVQKLAAAALPAGQVSRLNRTVGQPLEFLPGNGVLARDYQVRLPGGLTRYVLPDSLGWIRLENTNEPGIYTLFQGRQQLESIAVNIDHAESLPPGFQLPDMTGRISEVSSSSELLREVLHKRGARVLWPWFLGLVIVLFLLETWLARITSSWRQG